MKKKKMCSEFCFHIRMLFVELKALHLLADTGSLHCLVS